MAPMRLIGKVLSKASWFSRAAMGAIVGHGQRLTAAASVAHSAIIGWKGR